MMTRKSSRTATLTRPEAHGIFQVPASDLLWAALSKLSKTWACSVDTAAQRALILALTGWKLKFERRIAELSRFVGDPQDPFLRTCLLLRARFLQEEGEPLSDGDLTASLEMLLEELRERHTDGGDARLTTLLDEER